MSDCHCIAGVGIMYLTVSFVNLFKEQEMGIVAILWQENLTVYTPMGTMIIAFLLG